MFVTGYGSLIVPRAPFVLTFRPPRFLVEHGGKAVAFGATEGRLGFNPLKGASVEDVTLDVAEYPPVPVFSLHTEHFAFPIDTPTKVFSTSAEAGWRFELQLESASDTDEMVHVRGPLSGSVDLSHAPDGMRAVEHGRVEKKNGSAAWKEWEYARQGQPWHQRLYAVALLSTRKLGLEHHFAVTAQCAAQRRQDLFSFSDKLVAWLSSQQ